MTKEQVNDLSRQLVYDYKAALNRYAHHKEMIDQIEDFETFNDYVVKVFTERIDDFFDLDPDRF